MYLSGSMLKSNHYGVILKSENKLIFELSLLHTGLIREEYEYIREMQRGANYHTITLGPMLKIDG